MGNHRRTIAALLLVRICWTALYAVRSLTPQLLRLSSISSRIFSLRFSLCFFLLFIIMPPFALGIVSLSNPFPMERCRKQPGWLTSDFFSGNDQDMDNIRFSLRETTRVPGRHPSWKSILLFALVFFVIVLYNVTDVKNLMVTLSVTQEVQICLTMHMAIT